MKKLVFFEIFNNLKTNPKLMRKVKIFAAVAVVGSLSLGGVVIWAGVSALKYVVETGNQVMTSPSAQVHLEVAKTELQQLQFHPIRCWGKAQSLAMVQPWLERPALANLGSLREACFGSGDLSTSTEGSKI